MINPEMYIDYAKQINIYLYLLKNYKMHSLSKVLFTSICLKYCKSIDCSTNKKNDLLSFYFKELKKGNAFSYDNLKIALESMQILISNKIIVIDDCQIKLLKNIDYIRDIDMEKVSVSNFIKDIESLNIKSFLSEVLNCV